jgi:Tfp pilus assembly protein PilX
LKRLVGWARSFKESEQGMALVLAMFVVIILFILVAAFIPLMVNEMNLTSVQKKGNQAFYVAEAGLDQAVWTLQQGNNWQSYRASSPKTEAGQLTEGRYTLIYEALTSSVNQMKVTSEGYFPLDESGEAKRTVEAVLVNTRFSAFNHALQSQSSLGSPGDPSVEYGDVYAREYIDFQGQVPSSPNYYSIEGKGFKRNGSVIDHSSYSNLHVIPESDFPDLTESDLDFLKEQALKSNTYYTGAESIKSFTADDLAQINADNPGGAVVFVDTPSGGSYTLTNSADVDVAANSYFQGVFVVKGDLDVSGTGSGTVVGQDSNGDPVTLNGITFNGHVYIAGGFDWSGTIGIYGSVVAGRIDGNGTPNIWYDSTFQNSPILPTILGAIEVTSWHEKR